MQIPGVSYYSLSAISNVTLKAIVGEVLSLHSSAFKFVCSQFEKYWGVLISNWDWLDKYISSDILFGIFKIGIKSIFPYLIIKILNIIPL